MRNTSARRRAQGMRPDHARRYNGGAGTARRTEFSLAIEPETLPAGCAWCAHCRRVVRLRADGSMRAHMSERRITCPGSTPAAGAYVVQLCDHGHTPNERKHSCGCAYNLPKQAAS